MKRNGDRAGPKHCLSMCHSHVYARGSDPKTSSEDTHDVRTDPGSDANCLRIISNTSMHKQSLLPVVSVIQNTVSASVAHPTVVVLNILDL